MTNSIKKTESELKRLSQLKQQIESYTKVLYTVDKATDLKDFKVKAQQLKMLEKEYLKLYESLLPIIYPYQQMDDEKREKNSDLNISEMLDPIGQLDLQDKIITELEHQYKSCKAEYDKLEANRLSPDHKISHQAAGKLLQSIAADIKIERGDLEKIRKTYQQI